MPKENLTALTSGNRINKSPAIKPFLWQSIDFFHPDGVKPKCPGTLLSFINSCLAIGVIIAIQLNYAFAFFNNKSK